MMTFKELKKLVKLPLYKEQRVPTVKALEESGVSVVAEKILENHGSISVYQNGYVIYRAHKRVTVFSLRNCVHYKYDALEGAGHHIEEEEFDEYEWHIRLVLEGEDEENTTIMPPEKQIVQDDRDARAEELESAFSYDGYQVVRKELFAHLRDPAIVIRKDSITFNTACITGLEDVVYVHVMFNNDLKRIVVRGCDENDKDALRWCVAKPDKRKSRKMSCKPFATLVYQKMGWDSECRYKMLGYRITFEGETLYVFDLLVPEIFHEGQRKKNAVDSQDNAASTKPVNSRKGFYLDDIVGTFGVPVEEHRKESEVKQMDGYVSMGILTGKIAPEAGKD